MDTSNAVKFDWSAKTADKRYQTKGVKNGDIKHFLLDIIIKMGFKAHIDW